MSASATPKLTADDRRHAMAFRDAPFGPHGPVLQRIVNILRGPPVKGKHVLVCTKPHREWVLARLSGAKDKPVEILPDQVFSDPATAEWFVFKLRWKDLTGEELEDA